MPLEAWIFLLAGLVAIILMFAMIFFSILFADMEWDFVNPIDLCNQLNQYVFSEAIIHAFLTFIMIIPMTWSAILLNLPLLAWNAYKFHTQQLYYDSTEVFRMLKKHKIECFVKLGFYLLSFFFYLYRMIYALMTI